jgi:hypothetical protein
MRLIPPIAALLVALTLGRGDCWASTHSKRALIRILREQGFRGALTGDIHFTTVGTLRCTEGEFRVIYFEWYGPANPGSHRAQYRLLFLKGGNQYVGSYVISGGRVLIRHDSVLFSYDDVTGNVVTCSEIGEGEPAQLNDGGLIPFEK